MLTRLLRAAQASRRSRPASAAPHQDAEQGGGEARRQTPPPRRCQSLGLAAGSGRAASPVAAEEPTVRCAASSTGCCRSRSRAWLIALCCLFTVMKAPSPWARRLRLVVCSSWAAACSLLRRNRLPVREQRLSAGLGRTGAAGRVRERAHPRRAVHDAGRPARADHGGHVRASFPAHTSHQPPPCGALHRLRAVACVRTPYSQGGAPCPTRSPLSSLAAGTQHCSTLPQAGSARARR